MSRQTGRESKPEGGANLHRLEQLDSLRGLAALTVLLGHCLGLLPIFWIDTYGSPAYGWINLLKYSPLRLVIAGHEAVVFFFLLSGFVLMLPILRNGFQPFRSYAIRRIFRIYIPYLGAVGLAALLRASLSKPDLSGSGYSGWIAEQWHTPLTWQTALQHILLIGTFDTNSLNPVIWSLVHEMRISLVFPLLAYAVLRWNWKIVIALCPVIAVLGFGVHHLAFVDPRLWGGWFQMLDSLRYVPMFLIGALLAKHRRFLIEVWRERRRLPQALFVSGGLAAYTYPYWLLPRSGLLHMPFMDEFAALAGAAVFLTAAIASRRWAQALQAKPVLFLGRVSYSLYLYHFVILLAVVWTVPAGTPIVLIWMLVVAISLAVAAAAYRWVELPAIGWGKRAIGSKPRPHGVLLANRVNSRSSAE